GARRLRAAYRASVRSERLPAAAQRDLALALTRSPARDTSWLANARNARTDPQRRRRAGFPRFHRRSAGTAFVPSPLRLHGRGAAAPGRVADRRGARGSGRTRLGVSPLDAGAGGGPVAPRRRRADGAAARAR